MSGLQEAPDWVTRAVFYGIVLYFVVVLYSYAFDDPTARLASNALFGLVAIGLGAALLAYADDGLPYVAAAAALVVGGLAQLAWLVTFRPLLDLAATLAILAGVGLYVYAVRLRD